MGFLFIMKVSISPTPEDIRAALFDRAQLGPVETTVLRRLGLPSRKRTGESSLFHLRQINAELADMVCQWMQGTVPAGTGKATLKNVTMAPFSPGNINVPAYVKSLTEKHAPSVIAVDASPAEVGGALHYACSLLYGLQVPVNAALVKDTYIREEFSFQPGDFLPELAVYCFKNKLPLVPLSTPAQLVASEHQFNYNNMLQDAYDHFTHENITRMPLQDLEKRAETLMKRVFSAGIHLVMEREDLITQSCYTASRLIDLITYLPRVQKKKGRMLVFYKMKHVLDFSSLVQTFCKTPAARAELYSHADPLVDGSLTMHPAESTDGPPAELPQSSFARRIFATIEKILVSSGDETLGLDEVDRMAAEVAQALRSHPAIERHPGVRGTLATREIAQAYGHIRGSITREILCRAAHIAFSHRVSMKHGEETTLEDVFKSIFSRLIYNIPLKPTAEETAKEPRRALTPEELSQALMGLSDAAFSTLPPEQGLPVDDPAFAEEAMNHPLVQQALKDAMEKGLLNDISQDYKQLLQELEDRGLLEQSDPSNMTLSEKGQNNLKESIEEAMARGEVSAEELAEMLKNALTMPAPPGIDGEKLQLSPQAETELMAELMDFQHQGRSETTSLEDLYVHYTLNERKGIEVSEEKVDFEKLKIMIHQLEKKGVLNTSGERKRFALTHLSLEKLLEGLIRRQESQILEKRAFRREHETDKTEVRRYRRGDVFRELSLRHTLRRIIRKGKTFEDINYTDLRSFDKKPSNQLDIAVCVDISASMKESGKLRYAKMAVAELAKAAIEKHDRLGIVAFSNIGEVIVPLNDKITPLLEATMTLRAEQYTNIGNGLGCARNMLLKGKNSNPKYIILITDGQPNAAMADTPKDQTYHQQVAAFSRQTTMETKKAMGTHHALAEASKTSKKHIKISVVFISPEGEEDDDSERTAREIARIGGGKFHKVRSIERLPLEALAAAG